MKQLQIAALAFGLLTPALALADDGDELAKGVKAPTAKPAATRSAEPLGPKAPWPAAIKHRNARYAVLDRSFDATGDEHEVFVLNYELERLIDKLGDHEVERIYRQFGKGMRRVIHAQIARDQDKVGDAVQRHLATMSLSRRHADVRRTRDFSGDKVELVQWRRDRLKWGDLGPKAIMFGKQRADDKGRQRREQILDQRESSEHESKAKRDEQREEHRLDREYGSDRGLDRRMDRDEEREADAEIDDELEAEERDEERETERELDEETDRAIESASDGNSGNID